MLRTLINSPWPQGAETSIREHWLFLTSSIVSFTMVIPYKMIHSLALFVSYLHERKLAPSTFKSYLSAIGYVHKM